VATHFYLPWTAKGSQEQQEVWELPDLGHVLKLHWPRRAIDTAEDADPLYARQVAPLCDVQRNIGRNCAVHQRCDDNLLALAAGVSDRLDIESDGVQRRRSRRAGLVVDGLGRGQRVLYLKRSGLGELLRAVVNRHRGADNATDCVHTACKRSCACAPAEESISALNSAPCTS
jgi:hypothetical protein